MKLPNCGICKQPMKGQAGLCLYCIPCCTKGQAIADKQSITQEAEQIINGPRREAYGDYSKEAVNIAKVWSVIVGVEIASEKIPLMMIALKLLRENNSHKRDNLVDLVGYALLKEKLENSKTYA